MNNLSYQFLYLMAGAWRRRYFIVVPILLMPILGFLVASFSPKHYASHTSMLIQETAKMNPFLEDFAVSTMLKERMAALQTLLHSRHILGAVALEQKLISEQTSPTRFDQIIGELSTALSVQMAGKDLIRIDYKADSPDNMKSVLETVSKHFIEQLLAPERSSMKDASFFLAKHLNQRREDLDRAESALAEFKDTHAAELPELHLTNISRLTQLKQRLSERRAELAGADKSLGGLDQQLSRTNPVVGRIEEQIIRIRGELALLRARYTDNHSQIQGALRNLRRLEQERQNILEKAEQVVDASQLWDIASSTRTSDNNNHQPLLISQLENLQLARSRAEGLREETLSLKGMIDELEKRTVDYGDHEQTLNKLERDLKVKRKLYEDLLQRYEMARVTGSLSIFEQEKRVKVIDRPYTPTAPSNFPLVLFVLAGLLGGILLGAGLALLFELMDTTLRRRDQLEILTGVPVLTRIPRQSSTLENLT